MLATWRISSLFVSEAGPWNILAKFRHWVGIREDERGQSYGLNVLAGALSCIWCFSVWAGLGLAALHWLSPMLAFWLSLPLALSAAAIIIGKMIDG